MEKTIGEDELKGLEQEIDFAVDRLFVEKGVTETPSTASPFWETSQGEEKSIPLEEASHLPSGSSPFLKALEKMETQILSLEWEITKEELEKTKKEVNDFRNILKGEKDIVTVLNLMEKVLNHMLENEADINPPLVHFLLDSKDTIKLFVQKESSQEIKTNKHLVYEGIKARFSNLKELKGVQMKPTLPVSNGELDIPSIQKMEWKAIENTLDKINSLMEKIGETLKTIEHYFSSSKEGIRKIPEIQVETSQPAMNITVFRVDGKFFGIPSDRVFKLFKVPYTWFGKYSSQKTIRLKEFEVKMVDLKKIFSIQGEEPKGEIKILLMKDNGEYKGFLVEQVLERISTHTEVSVELNEYLLGITRWTYQKHLVEVPILDLKKL